MSKSLNPCATLHDKLERHVGAWLLLVVIAGGSVGFYAQDIARLTVRREEQTTACVKGE